jgi:hypothetical protein
MKRFISFGFVLGLFLSSTAFAMPGDSVLVRCEGSCDTVASRIEAAGGSITYRYKYVNALAATLPFEHYGKLGGWSGVSNVYKDLLIDEPRAVESVELDDEWTVLETAGPEGVPKDYAESTDMTGVDSLFNSGHLGDGVKVAVIDSGTAQVSAFSRGGCTTQDPTVIGGETYIAAAGPGEPSATSPANGAHGTQVGTTVAGNVIFLFASGSVLAQSVVAHSPASALVGIVPGATGIPMIGTAPCSQIYALKVFRAAGGGAPRSDILAAMERAIELRENFNNGVPSEPVSGSGTPADPFIYDSLDISVVNMSLGGPTLHAGFELTDKLTEKMLEMGITVVNSAGNAGHAAMTGSSSGTGFGSLTAGAASLTHNERILRDVQFGLGIGALYRPSDHHQMATFSSRGPSPDGRINVDAVANGFANFVQGPTGGLSLVSGTSFSAPTIAGAAATLKSAVPAATALQVRNALVETANPDFLGDLSAPIDQGHGFINVANALQALQAGSVSNDLPSGPGGNSVRGSIASAGFRTLQLGESGHSAHIADLLPGQVQHFFVSTTADTEALHISFSDVTPELPPAEQNPFFGDDLFVVVQDALTSAAASLASGFIAGDTTLVAEKPQAGIVRIAVMGDWTNAGRISTDIDIRSVRGKSPKNTDRDRLQQGEMKQLDVEVPAGTSQANFELRWQQDWGAYPTDDLDLIVFDPNGNPIIEFDAQGNPFLPGATLRSPERVVVNNPVPGTYTVLINGFTVWTDRGSRAQYSFHAFDQDGSAF